MSPEEKGGLLSSYLEGELDEEQVLKVEAMLAGDAELEAQLEEILLSQEEETKNLGLALKSALEEEAGSVNFEAMEAAVLREVIPEPAQDRVRGEAESSPGFWEVFRAFVERPAVAFALGLLVAGMWGSWSPIQNQGDGPAVQYPAVSPSSAQRVPAAPMRAPEAEQSFAKASPSLFLETLSVEKGKVVLDQDDDDPDAPVVLWHFSESSDSDGAAAPKATPRRTEEGPTKEGDPL